MLIDHPEPSSFSQEVKKRDRSNHGSDSDENLSGPTNFKVGNRQAKKNKFVPFKFPEKDKGYPQKFYVISRADGDFTTFSLIKLCRMINFKFGKVKSFKKIDQGKKILVESIDILQASAIRDAIQLDNIPINVSAHRTLNSSKGVITCRHLMDCSETEILEELETQGVTSVKIIQRKIKEELTPTSTIILTFDTPILNVAYMKIKVRRYIPQPLQCFKCFKYGHSSSTCKRDPICLCGRPKHEGVCQEPAICPNCEGDHNARSRICPVYLAEKEIQQIKAEQNISYTDAKKLVNNNSFKKAKTIF